MGKYGIKILFISIAILSTIEGMAQQLSSYTLEYLPQRSYLNPSFMPHSKIHVGIPLFSGVSHNYSNNGFTYSDLIQKSGNDSLYMDVKNAINQLNNSNRINYDLEIELFSVGFRKGKNYFSFNATEKAQFTFTYSKALMEFLYYGNAPTAGTTQILNPTVEGNHYREYGVSWAREITSKIKGGVKLKYLYGMEHVSSRGRGVSIYTDPNDFTITANSDLMVYTSGVDSSTRFNNYMFGRENKGYAIDLGFTFKPIQQIEISGAALDMGSITWKSNVTNYSTTTQEGTFTYNGINLNEFVNNDSTSAEEYLSDLADSLYTSFDLQTTHESFKQKLPLNLYVSASYLLTPRYRINVVVRNKKFITGNQTDYQLSFTGRSSTWFNYTIRMNKINKSSATLGAGFTLNFKNNQVYFVSDNVPGLINWKKAHNTGFRAGINLMFGTKPKYMKPPQPVLEPAASSTPK